MVSGRVSRRYGASEGSCEHEDATTGDEEREAGDGKPSPNGPPSKGPGELRLHTLEHPVEIDGDRESLGRGADPLLEVIAR